MEEWSQVSAQLRKGLLQSLTRTAEQLTEATEQLAICAKKKGRDEANQLELDEICAKLRVLIERIRHEGLRIVAELKTLREIETSAREMSLEERVELDMLLAEGSQFLD
jgi:hypothetical protein